MLSIIIPTLNEERYLPLLLESIKKQDFKESLEIIVADAGSSDKTVEIAKKYDCKVVKGGLPAKGRNEGAKVAIGELLLFLDADVILPAGFLNIFLRKFYKKKLDIASTGLRADSKRRIYKVGSRLWNLYFKTRQYSFPCAGGFCILTKASFFKKLGGFDETIKVGEDCVYVRKAKKIGRFHFFSSPKFLISTRRFDTEGILKSTLKYIAIDSYMIFIGPIRSDIFRYKFAHYSKKEKTKVK